MTTFGSLKRQIANKMRDSQMQLISEALYEQFLLEAYDDLRMAGWLTPLEEDESIVQVADTYDYAVPNGFAYIYKLMEEDSNGDYNLEIPRHQWGPGYDEIADVEFLSYGREYKDGERNLGDVAADTQLAQGFKVDRRAQIGNVRLPLKKVGSPSDNLTVEIQSDSSGSPSGTALTNGTSDTVAASSIETTEEWVAFDFDDPVSLAADTQYHLVLKRSGSVDADNYFVWAIDVDGMYDDGQLAAYNGAAWSAVTGADGIFRLHHPSGVGPIIRLKSIYWSATAGRRIKILGQKRPPKPDDDTDEIFDSFVAYLRERAVAKAILYVASVPVEAPDERQLQIKLAAANQRFGAANIALMEAERMLSRHPMELRVKPNSRHVVGR